MADDPPSQPELSPEEIATQVAAILRAAERDARATIEAARRLPELGEPAETLEARSNGSDLHLRESLGELTGAVEGLTRRVDALEAGLERGAVVSRPDQGSSKARPGRAERLRVVDLALRGMTRAQIAEELRASLSEREIERLLDEVLEP